MGEIHRAKASKDRINIISKTLDKSQKLRGTHIEWWAGTENVIFNAISRFLMAWIDLARPFAIWKYIPNELKPPRSVQKMSGSHECAGSPATDYPATVTGPHGPRRLLPGRNGCNHNSLPDLLLLLTNVGHWRLVSTLIILQERSSEWWLELHKYGAVSRDVTKGREKNFHWLSR